MFEVKKTLLIIYFIIYFILMNVAITISAIITHTYIFIKIQIIIQFSYYVMNIWLFRRLYISYYNIINIIKYDRHSLAWGYERFINPRANVSMGIQMISLKKLDWDEVEKLIEKMLNEHMRTWEDYNYFVINDDTILVKVYDENSRLMFTIKAKLYGESLEPVEVI